MSQWAIYPERSHRQWTPMLMSQSHFTLPQFPVPTGGFLELIYGLITDVENRHFWILPDQQRNELFPHIIGLSLLIYFRSLVFKKPSWSHFLPVPSPHLSFSPLLLPCTCSVCLLCGLLSGKCASSAAATARTISFPLPAPGSLVPPPPPPTASSREASLCSAFLNTNASKNVAHHIITQK